MIDVFTAGLPIWLPFIVAVITLLAGKYLKEWLFLLPMFSIGGAALVSFTFLFHDVTAGIPLYIDFFFPVNFFGITNPEIGIWLDPLSVFFVVIVSGLSLLIAIFSIAYMEHDKWLIRYWFFFQLFVGGMNLLVLAADVVFFYIGWATVGLCSYALIGHWFKKSGEEGRKTGLAGIKAFIYTHIGDLGLLFAIAILFAHTGFLNIQAIAGSLSTSLPLDQHSLVLALIFMGAVGKSAQFPLMTWLSSPDSVDIDAMQGPTTVSALIHAATMVKAGIYLMARMFPVFRSEYIIDFAILMAIIVSITIIISALGALTAKDLKRVLAYSTVSQLSYIFLALCVAYFIYSENQVLGNTAFLASQFHVLSHAVFKALLFLAAGSIIHATHTRSMLDLGGLRSRMPIPFYTMVIGSAALMGIPLFSGFFSKEAIIGVAFKFALLDSPFAVYAWLLFLMGIFVAFLTAAYTTRMIFLVFMGEPQSEGAKNPHNTGPLMHIPLLILAGLAVIVGFLPEVLNQHFKVFLGSGEGHLHLLPKDSSGFIAMLMVISAVGFGILICYLIYRDGNRSWHLPKIAGLSQLQTLVAEGFYIDQLFTWMGKQIMLIFYTVRRIHTGDSNYNMAGVGLIIAMLLAVLIVF